MNSLAVVIYGTTVADGLLSLQGYNVRNSVVENHFAKTCLVLFIIISALIGLAAFGLDLLIVINNTFSTDTNINTLQLSLAGLGLISISNIAITIKRLQNKGHTYA